MCTVRNIFLGRLLRSYTLIDNPKSNINYNILMNLVFNDNSMKKEISLFTDKTLSKCSISIGMSHDNGVRIIILDCISSPIIFKP